MPVGGARIGAGAPTQDTCRIRITVSNATRVKLERLAKDKQGASRTGLNQFGIARRLGIIVDSHFEKIEVEEPLYLRLAREAAAEVNGHR